MKTHIIIVSQSENLLLMLLFLLLWIRKANILITLSRVSKVQPQNWWSSFSKRKKNGRREQRYSADTSPVYNGAKDIRMNFLQLVYMKAEVRLPTSLYVFT
jgi:flagellar basal body-associated protein FliL